MTFNALCGDLINYFALNLTLLISHELRTLDHSRAARYGKPRNIQIKPQTCGWPVNLHRAPRSNRGGFADRSASAAPCG
ncbi:hypothetical protein T4B_3229 [Trichinella pseudospiralis]|uniref:Uncharacterized protein n=1 Tax=Trichinella pseudospiralis TaxID=6337 RepID=A0A0V1JIX4_TRIPS|nr:hypothetical protein T4B_3229 [Trichinella pseudospiralis]KRZ44115.1 hypothetical protein T4C_12103 [Trichinella pseudospiralis]